jgi:hypothetical protein
MPTATFAAITAFLMVQFGKNPKAFFDVKIYSLSKFGFWERFFIFHFYFIGCITHSQVVGNFSCRDRLRGN